MNLVISMQIPWVHIPHNVAMYLYLPDVQCFHNSTTFGYHMGQHTKHYKLRHSCSWYSKKDNTKTTKYIGMQCYCIWSNATVICLQKICFCTCTPDIFSLPRRFDIIIKISLELITIYLIINSDLLKWFIQFKA